MKNINLIQSLKVTILGIILSVGISTVFAVWSAPSGTPSPLNNTPAPINVSGTPQVKGTGSVVSGPSGFVPPLLDIRGTFSADSLVVWQQAIFNNSVKINNLNPTTDIKQVCIGTDGSLVVCAN